MELLYRTKAPAYKGCAPPPERSAGFLSGLGCYLFGGGSAPAYRTVNGESGSAAAPARCWWQAFPPTPQYKAAPPEHVDEPAPGAPAESADGDGAGCDCPEGDDSEGLPPEIYVWEE